MARRSRKYVLDSVDSENDRALEAETFNAGQRQDAYDKAYTAALKLFEEYKKNAKRRQKGRNGDDHAGKLRSVS